MDRRLHRSVKRLGNFCHSAKCGGKFLVFLFIDPVIVRRVIDRAWGGWRKFEMVIFKCGSQECTGLAKKYHARIPPAIGIDRLVPAKFRTVYPWDGKNKCG